MEILRFEENNSFAPRRRKSPRVWVVLAFFGVVLGVGSAFASSTIAINGNNKIDLGQGVSVVTACDTAIGVKAQSGLNPATDPISFYLKKLTLSGVDRTSSGCGGKYFDIQLFHDDGSTVAYPCSSFTFPGSDPIVTLGADNVTYGCNNSTGLYAQISAAVGETNADLVFNFSNAPSDITNITIVSRDA